MEAALAMCSLDIIIQSNPDAQTLTLTPPRKKRKKGQFLKFPGFALLSAKHFLSHFHCSTLVPCRKVY